MTAYTRPINWLGWPSAVTADGTMHTGLDEATVLAHALAWEILSLNPPRRVIVRDSRECLGRAPAPPSQAGRLRKGPEREAHRTVQPAERAESVLGAAEALP